MVVISLTVTARDDACRYISMCSDRSKTIYDRRGSLRTYTLTGSCLHWRKQAWPDGVERERHDVRLWQLWLFVKSFLRNCYYRCEERRCFEVDLHGTSFEITFTEADMSL